MNLNKVFLAGRLTRDPQLRYTPNGTAVCDIGLAVNRVFTDASGQRREETCFVECVLWSKMAELCARHLRKGSPIFIEGRLSYETWESKDGQKRSRLRVVGENFQFMPTAAGRAVEEVPEELQDTVSPEPPEEEFPPPIGEEEEVPF